MYRAWVPSLLLPVMSAFFCHSCRSTVDNVTNWAGIDLVQIDFMFSLLSVGAIFGSFTVGTLSTSYGHRTSIFLSCVPYDLGSLLMVNSSDRSARLWDVFSATSTLVCLSFPLVVTRVVAIVFLVLHHMPPLPSYAGPLVQKSFRTSFSPVTRGLSEDGLYNWHYV